MQLDINYRELALLRHILREMKGDFFKVWYKEHLLTNKTKKVHLDNTLYDRYMDGEYLDETTEDIKSCFSLLSKINKIEEEIKKEIE